MVRQHIIISFICLLMLSLVFAEPSLGVTKIQEQRVTGTKATTESINSVRLHWSKLSRASGYQVYFSKTGRHYKLLYFVSSKKGSVVVKGLQQGSYYFFKIRAFRRGSKYAYSHYSKTIRYKVPSEKELRVRTRPVLTVRAIEPRTDRLKLSFTKCKGATGYEIWRSKEYYGTYARIKFLPKDSNAYIHVGLKPATRYYYKVRPYVKVGKTKLNGRYSNIAADITNGNSSQYNLDNIPTTYSSLANKKILFLGSSITQGSYHTNMLSFVDYLAASCNVDAEKNAKGGTTISTVKEDSYIERLEEVTYDSERSLVVCQLSTNDSRYNVPARIELGSEESLQEDDGSDVSFDDLNELRKYTNTIRGAIDYIIAYSKTELNCPTVFYVIPYFQTTPTFDAEFYSEMRDVLYEARDYWNTKDGYSVSIIDMQDTVAYPQFEMFKTYDEKRSFYMRDAVHPTKAGYYRYYLPVMEEYLSDVIE